MKWYQIRLALAVLALVLVACSPATVIVPGATPPPSAPPASPPASPPVIPPPAGLTGPVLAALYDGSTVRLWDGTNAVTWKTGAAVAGNGRKIAVGRTLYFLDASGAVTSSMNLPASPSGVAVVGDPVVYTFEAIDSQWALDHGALYRPYTRVWKDGVEDADWPWYGNQWTYASSFEAANGDVVAVDAGGHFWDISRPTLTNVSTGFQNIAWAWAGGPIFYFPDPALNQVTVYDAAHPGGASAIWSGGNAGAGWGPATVWTLFNGVYYSAYGDSWDGTTLIARGTAMGMWNAVPSLAWSQANYYTWPQTVDRPRMLVAYTDASNMYFVECNTGLLVSWTPQTGVVTRVQNGNPIPQLYVGDGKAATGDENIKTLKPELVNGSLYYHQAGTLWRQEVSDFSIPAQSFSADQQMWVMK